MFNSGFGATVYGGTCIYMKISMFQLENTRSVYKEADV